MDVQVYLDRINYHGSLTPNAETLAALHEAHLLAVPFENLNIHLKRPIVLDEAALLDKVVTQHRGGFCYELNTTFAWLLSQLGFDVQKLAAGVTNGSGDFSPPFDHMTLLVSLEDRWLADVGFGDSFRKPLLLDKKGSQSQNGQEYRIIQDGENRIYQQCGSSGWENQYRFTLQAYQLSDYADYCFYHQTSPDSHFTQKRICTLATSQGRITLSDMRLITTIDSQRTEKILESQEAYQAVLREQFGIVL